jgi:hypothetical protein
MTRSKVAVTQDLNWNGRDDNALLAQRLVATSLQDEGRGFESLKVHRRNNGTLFYLWGYLWCCNYINCRTTIGHCNHD